MDLRDGPDEARFRTTLRNYQSTLGWWDGDRATTNSDRQRTEVNARSGCAQLPYNIDQGLSGQFDAKLGFGDFTSITAVRSWNSIRGGDWDFTAADLHLQTPLYDATAHYREVRDKASPLP